MSARLNEYWEGITPAPPEMDALVEGGEAARRRRRRLVTAGAAALTALVVASGVVVQQALDDDADVTPAQLIPTPPEGTRWVGAGRAVVAVPEWWTTGETQCLTPVETTVAYFSGAQADCADPAPAGVVQEVSFLEVMDATAGYGEHVLGSMQPLTTVGGAEVLELPDCDEWYPGTCRRLFAVPSQGVVFGVTIADAEDGDYATIRDSLTILPEEVTTVPLDAGMGGYTPQWGDSEEVVGSLLRRLDDAGFDIDLVQAPPPDPAGAAGDSADLAPGSYLGAEPELGSPIERGGTIRVTVAPVLLPTNGWQPGDRSLHALGGGFIAIDHEGCVYLTSGNGDATYVLWPKGFHTGLDEGVLTILGPDGAELAREGHEIRVGGGSVPVPETYADQPCLPSPGEEVFSIMSEVPLRN